MHPRPITTEPTKSEQGQDLQCRKCAAHGRRQGLRWISSPECGESRSIPMAPVQSRRCQTVGTCHDKSFERACPLPLTMVLLVNGGLIFFFYASWCRGDGSTPALHKNSP